MIAFEIAFDDVDGRELVRREGGLKVDLIDKAGRQHDN